jgi:P27 family predicted phage terminase small subunit
MKGRKPQLRKDSKAIGRKKPPEWLTPFAKEEWKRCVPELAARGILTVADLGCLESYCIAIGRIREIELLLREGIDLKLLRAQDKAMVTARQLAAELGLTPVSRSRPAVRENDDDGDGDDDENPLAIV